MLAKSMCIGGTTTMSIINGTSARRAIRGRELHSVSCFRVAEMRAFPQVVVAPEEFSLFVEALQRAWVEMRANVTESDASPSTWKLSRAIARVLLSAVKAHENMDADGLVRATLLYIQMDANCFSN
jgi:hypothetical protein